MKYIIGIIVISTLGWMIYNSEKCTYNIQTKTETCERVFGDKEDTQIKSKYITVKYRDDGPVNINNSAFDYQNTSSSSFVGGVWYDKSEDYMIIKIQNTHYHYCNFPSSLWISFKKADSSGSYYNKNIKGNYSCKDKKVPSYGDVLSQEPDNTKTNELNEIDITQKVETTQSIVKVTAVCGTAFGKYFDGIPSQNLCERGISINMSTSGEQPYNWQCKYQNNVKNCFAFQKRIDAVCGNKLTCTQGEMGAVEKDDSGEKRWVCKREGSGNDVSCEWLKENDCGSHYLVTPLKANA